MGGYWKELHQRSAKQAAVDLGLSSRAQIVIRLAIAAVVVGGLLLFGSEDASSDEWKARVFAAFAVILLFPIFYIWNFAKAPAALDRERMVEIAKLSEATAAKNLTIRAPIVITRGGLQTICMEIENGTGRTIESCSVKLIEVTGLSKEGNDFVRHLPIWLLTKDQNGPNPGKHFKLFRGEKVVVDFGSLDLRGDRSEIIFHFREWILKTPSDHTYGLRVGVYSEKSDAEELVFRVAKVGEHLASNRVS